MADASSALRKLQSGQTLTDAEKKLLGIGVATPTPTPTQTFATTGNTFTDTLNQLRAARGITPENVSATGQLDVQGLTEQRLAAAQAVAAKPVMTAAQEAGGGVVKWIGGIDGKYEIVMPIGSPLVGSKAAGWEPGRNNLAGKPTNTTKVVKTSVKNADGSTTVTYTDDTVEVIPAPVVTGTDADYAIVNGILNFKGAPFSGSYKGKNYSNGVEVTGGGTIINTPLGGDLSNPAFSIVEGILKNYDMKGVADSIAKIRKDYPEIASDDILALLKFDTRYNKPYLERFAGNAELIKKGLPTLSDEAYLKVEKEYEKIFKAYDVGSLASRQMYAKLIGNSMDAVDVTGRLKVGYERLKADKNIETAFREFYPSLSNGDIVAAMLNPDEMLPALERKAAAAEIGGSYLAQGLKTSLASAESLAAYGIDKAGAQAGVRYIAQALPRGQFLSQISQETGINYTQQTAEDITFKKNVKAQKEEELLKAKEVGRFGGTAGLIGSKALASQQRGAGII